MVALWAMDSLPALPIVLPALRKVAWRAVLPVAFGFAATVWLGVWWLTHGDPTMLRWAISASILVAVAVLASGWRFGGRRSSALSFAVGTVPGFFGGAAQLSGPPVLVYWLAGDDPAWRMRANIIVLFFTLSLLSGTSMALNGLLVADAVKTALVCAPVFAVALYIGQRGFARATDAGYRRLAFVLILIVATATLPVFGG